MSLTPVTTATKVYSTLTDGNIGYNDIRTVLVDIIGAGTNGYGYQSIPSTYISTGTIISAQQWQNLKSNIELVDIHLNTATSTATITYPLAGSTVSANFVNELVTLLNFLDNKKNLRPESDSQRATAKFVSTSTGSSWILLEHVIQLQWDTNTNARRFFNLGGRLETANSLHSISTATFTYSNYVSLTNTFISTSTSGNTTATVTYTKIDARTISMGVRLRNSLGTTVVRNTSSYEYSIGAFNAPRPSVTSLIVFEDAVPVPPPPPLTRTLTVTTPSAYSFITGQTSAAQTISITNNGNSTATITDIIFTNAPDIYSGYTVVEEVVNLTGLGGSKQFTLNPSQTKTFTLAYRETDQTAGGRIGGPYNSSFTINSNNDAGAITIPTYQTITRVGFTITVAPPTPVIDSLLGYTTYRRDFIITSTNGDTFTYTASLSSQVAPSGAAGWSIDNSLSSGPSVSFSPVGTTATTYAATVTLNITAYSDVSGTDSATISITINGDTGYTPSTTYNLGTWMSPAAPYNSLIGMSYDVIAGERYLTIGVGMNNTARGGGDTVNLNAAGGWTYADVANLGINADADFKLGQQQFYGYFQNGNWNPFLKAYGVWPLQNTNQPLNYNVGTTAKYRIGYLSAGTYTYEFSSDDDSSFTIVECDQYGLVSETAQVYFLADQLVTGGAQSNWRNSYFGSIDLPAGYYIVSIEYQNNIVNQAAAAFQILSPDGNVVWNTRYPVRSNPDVYPYWQEVMRFRIPADGTARDIYSYYQYVKNSYEVYNKYHWGTFFVGTIFKVRDDGAGNVTVTFFNNATAPSTTQVPDVGSNDAITETLRWLPASFYYYLPFPDRYTNLDAGPAGDGTQTRYFTGFDRDGAVVTVLQQIPDIIPYPTIPYTPPGGGGGGGGGGFDPGFDPFQQQYLV